MAGGPAGAFRLLKVLVAAAPRTVILTATDDYLHAACRTRLGFVSCGMRADSRLPEPRAPEPQRRVLLEADRYAPSPARLSRRFTAGRPSWKMRASEPRARRSPRRPG